MAIGGSDPLHTAATRRPDSPDMDPSRLINSWPIHVPKLHRWVFCMSTIRSFGRRALTERLWVFYSRYAHKVPQGGISLWPIPRANAFTSSDSVHTCGHQHLQRDVVITNHKEFRKHSCNRAILFFFFFFIFLASGKVLPGQRLFQVGSMKMR